MHSASSSSCISLNGSSYTHAAIGGELLPACVDHLAPGKAVFVGAWEGHCGLHGCTHCRRGTNTTNCGLPQHLGGASCAPLVQRTLLNHYAYQSQAAWEAKKRGNVLGRKGAVPEIYEKVRDDTGVELLSERIRRAHAATPRYGRCLGALFFGRGDT